MRSGSETFLCSASVLYGEHRGNADANNAFRERDESDDRIPEGTVSRWSSILSL